MCAVCRWVDAMDGYSTVPPFTYSTSPIISRIFVDLLGNERMFRIQSVISSSPVKPGRAACSFHFAFLFFKANITRV
jgi:hypothetical protein